MNCPLCEVATQCHNKQHPLLIHEFSHSYWLFGQHQFYRGYSVLVLKQHARELHALPADIHEGVWRELMQVGAAIDKIFQPWKLNYASYGNQVEHIHWHIFPRYVDELTRKNCPFSNEAEFKKYPTDVTVLNHEKAMLQQFIKQLL